MEIATELTHPIAADDNELIFRADLAGCDAGLGRKPMRLNGNIAQCAGHCQPGKISVGKENALDVAFVPVCKYAPTSLHDTSTLFR